MMGRGLGLGGLLIGLIVLFLVRANSKHNAGEEYLAQSRDMVATIPAFRAKAEYVDWLALEAHNDCFSDSYSQEYGRRGRGGKVTVDSHRYLTDMFSHMIAQAESDREKEVAAQLVTLRKEVLGE
jgi:hypothetical protein